MNYETTTYISNMSDPIASVISGSLTGILGGLNINSGNRMKAKAEQMRAAGEVAAMQQAQKIELLKTLQGPTEKNNSKYIAIGIGLIVVAVIIFFVIKKN